MGAENYTDDGSSLLELAVFTENYKLLEMGGSATREPCPKSPAKSWTDQPVFADENRSSA